MKTSKVDKIRNYFTEIKTEAVFTALKEKKYSGFTRPQINQLLQKYDSDKVLSILKKRHKKHNYMLIYGITFLILSFILIATVFYLYNSTNELILLRYFDIEYFSYLQIIDYCILLVASLSVLSFILCLYEITLKLIDISFFKQNWDFF